MQKIDVHVDYKTEIEPFLKHQLVRFDSQVHRKCILRSLFLYVFCVALKGEGGFGKVYQATFRDVDVAVKVIYSVNLSTNMVGHMHKCQVVSICTAFAHLRVGLNQLGFSHIGSMNVVSLNLSMQTLDRNQGYLMSIDGMNRF